MWGPVTLDNLASRSIRSHQNGVGGGRGAQGARLPPNGGGILWHAAHCCAVTNKPHGLFSRKTFLRITNRNGDAPSGAMNRTKAATVAATCSVAERRLQPAAAAEWASARPASPTQGDHLWGKKKLTRVKTPQHQIEPLFVQYGSRQKGLPKKENRALGPRSRTTVRMDYVLSKSGNPA